MTAEWKPTHRHKKRGTTYVIVGQALLQASEPVFEDAILTVYRGENGELWCRPIREFGDGRFEAIAGAAIEGARLSVHNRAPALTKRVAELEKERDDFRRKYNTLVNHSVEPGGIYTLRCELEEAEARATALTKRVEELETALRIYAQSLRGSYATRNDIANELDALAKAGR